MRYLKKPRSPRSTGAMSFRAEVRGAVRSLPGDERLSLPLAALVRGSRLTRRFPARSTRSSCSSSPRSSGSATASACARPGATRPKERGIIIRLGRAPSFAFRLRPAHTHHGTFGDDPFWPGSRACRALLRDAETLHRGANGRGDRVARPQLDSLISPLGPLPVHPPEPPSRRRPPTPPRLACSRRPVRRNATSSRPSASTSATSSSTRPRPRGHRRSRPKPTVS